MPMNGLDLHIGRSLDLRCNAQREQSVSIQISNGQQVATHAANWSQEPNLAAYFLRVTFRPLYSPLTGSNLAIRD